MKTVNEVKNKQNTTKNLKQGFTLLELLVVVLIIGILAGIALPQYKKAVDKSTAAQGIAIMKPIWQSIENYYLANNEFPTSFAQLDVEIPWNGDIKGINSVPSPDTRSNDKWSLQILNNHSSYQGLVITMISGKYTGGGFSIFKNHESPSIPRNILLCSENYFGEYALSKKGLFCQKLFKGEKIVVGSFGSAYTFEQ